MTTRVRLAAFPGYAVERSAGEHGGIELLVCRTVRYRRQPDGRAFRRAQAVVARSPDARAAVNAEIALLAACAGPGVPRLLEGADGTYVTPLLSPETLEDRLATGDLGDDDLRRASACLRSAVLALHDAARVHGRLGAAAVRFTDDGEPVLTGLRETAPLTGAGRERDLRALDALRARLGTEATERPVSAAKVFPGSIMSPGTADGASTDIGGIHGGVVEGGLVDSGDPAATVLRELAQRRAARRPDPARSGPRRESAPRPQRRRVVLAAAGGVVGLGALTATGFALTTVNEPAPSAERVSGIEAEDASATAAATGESAEPAGAAASAEDARPSESAGAQDTAADAAEAVEVLQDLVDARTAWITGSSASDTANAPGSTAMSGDSELRSAWEGAEVSDWSVRVLEVTAVEGDLGATAGSAFVVLDARMQDLAGTATWADGTGVEIPGSGVYSTRVTLQPVEGEWRIVEVTRR